MSSQQKRLAILLGVVVMLAAAAYVLRKRAPQSLAAAFEQRKEDLAGAYDVLLPVAAGTRLGTRVHSRDANTGRVTLDLNPCFFVPPPVQQPSLSELMVQYQSAQSLAAEFETLLAGSASESDGAMLLLKNLRVVSGLGVINPNGACSSEGEYTIVTQEIVAGSAELSSGSGLSVNAKASATQEHAQVATGWSQSGVSQVTGQDIVLGGVLQRVHVSTLTQDPFVWIDPPLGSSVPLPTGIIGTLEVEDYSAGNWLKVTVTAPGNLNVTPPDRFEVCSVGSVQKIELPGTCYYLISANVLLSVSTSFDQENKLHLRMIGYRTEYSDQLQASR